MADTELHCKFEKGTGTVICFHTKNLMFRVVYLKGFMVLVPVSSFVGGVHGWDSQTSTTTLIKAKKSMQGSILGAMVGILWPISLPFIFYKMIKHH